MVKNSTVSFRMDQTTMPDVAMDLLHDPKIGL